MAAQNIINLLGELRARVLITDDEFLRLAYRFAGEIVDVEDMIEKARAQGPAKFPIPVAPAGIRTPAGDNKMPGAIPSAASQRTPSKTNADVIDLETGEPKTSKVEPQ